MIRTYENPHGNEDYRRIFEEIAERHRNNEGLKVVFEEYFPEREKRRKALLSYIDFLEEKTGKRRHRVIDAGNEAHIGLWEGH